jgi:hypothetical protein
LDYAAEVCDGVVEILKTVSDHKIIINLPATLRCRLLIFMATKLNG